MKRVLVVCEIGNPIPPIMKLEVLGAEMSHPGWMRFTLEAGAPDWEEPTICWYRVPEGASVELQSQIEDQDVIDRFSK
jgi:hypothetical protein